MDTRPMPLDTPGAAARRLDDFRVGTASDIAAIVKRLVDGHVPLNLNVSDGSVVSTMLWTADAERRSIGFRVEVGDPGVQRLLESQESVAVGYLDAVKLQFDLDHPVLVRGAGASVLRCGFPCELYRFQRRNAYRVRPLLRSAATARLRHRGMDDLHIVLRVLDVSIGGCALFLPDDLPPLQPGMLLEQARIELDAATCFHVDLRLQHITSINPEPHGVRLGCEFEGLGVDGVRALQRFIDQTQKRAKLLARE